MLAIIDKTFIWRNSMTPNILLFLLLFLSSYPQHSNAQGIQSISSIQEAIEQYISSQLATNTDYKIRHSRLDRRLALSLCNKPLNIFNPRDALQPGRNSIVVKCNGEKTWHIYTSVNISIYQNVIVLTHAVRRGEIFDASALQLEKRELSALRSGFFSTPEPILNQQATRNLSAGTVMTQSHYTKAKLIKRGERVYITTNRPHLHISMAGIAMMDGVKGQNIRVKNLTSHHIVHGVVTRPGQVVVFDPDANKY